MVVVVLMAGPLSLSGADPSSASADSVVLGGVGDIGAIPVPEP
jgi:hypothetical protein